MTDPAPEKKRPHPLGAGLVNGEIATMPPVARAIPNLEPPALRDRVSGVPPVRTAVMVVARMPGKTRPAWAMQRFGLNATLWNMPKWLSAGWRCRLMVRP